MTDVPPAPRPPSGSDDAASAATATTVEHRGTDDCLVVEELVAMLDGALTNERAEIVLAHVDRCRGCAKIVATLGVFDDREVRRVGRYEPERVLGAGGMGIVYSAWDPELHRKIALKLVRPEQASEASRARMLSEARALARISHPNVVAVHDVGEHRGDIYVATELVDGETLATWQRGRSTSEILAAWLQVARGLEAAHAEGVVHRDVKPANVFVGRDGRVRVGDFGIARHGDGRVSEQPLAIEAPVTTGTIAGTPAYMAPEQHAGVIDARSDQFAASVAIVEALTGTRPGAGDEVSLEPPALATVLTRGIRVAPESRFPTMREFADALEEVVASPVRRSRAKIVGVSMVVLTTSLAIWLATRGTTATCVETRPPDALWSPARRAQIASTHAQNVAVRIDRWLDAWSTASVDVCTTDRDAVAVQERRRGCLVAELHQLGRLLDRLASNANTDRWRVQQELDKLPRPSRCSHNAVAPMVVPTVLQVAQIEALRARMALADDGDDSYSEATLREFVASAEAFGHAPFTAELMVKLAEVELEDAAAQTTLRRASAIAKEGRDGMTEIAATILLMRRLGAASVDEIERLSDQVRAQVTALGGDPVIEANAEHVLCHAYKAIGKSERARTPCDRARHGFRAGFQAESASEALALLAVASSEEDPERTRSMMDEALAMLRRFGLAAPGSIPAGDPDALIAATAWVTAAARAAGQETTELKFTNEANLGNAYWHKDDLAHALEHFQRAAILGEEVELDATKVRVHYRCASVLIELGRAKEALPSAIRALELAEQLADDSERAFALEAVGLARLALGETTARELLERAVELRDRTQADGLQRGTARFLLARALFATNPDRARSLAHAAKMDLQGYLAKRPEETVTGRWYRRQTEAQLDAIGHWIASHR